MGRPVGHPPFQITASGNWTGVARAARRTDGTVGPPPLTTQSVAPVPRHGRCSAVSVAPAGARPAGGDLKEDGMKRLFLAAAMLLLATSVFAQIGGGTLLGTVTDEQGGVLPGATVTIAGTDRTTTATSDEAGKFRFLNLAPGPYTITVALQGFSTVVREHVVVAVGVSIDVPAQMKVATVAETVTVSGASPIVDTKA